MLSMRQQPGQVHKADEHNGAFTSSKDKNFQLELNEILELHLPGVLLMSSKGCLCLCVCCMCK